MSEQHQRISCIRGLNDIKALIRQRFTECNPDNGIVLDDDNDARR